MLTLSEVTFAYPNQPPVFEHYNWHVAQGDIWAVLGPSGCGKSTLLLLLAGLQNPDHGTVTVHDTPLTRPRPNTGLILQDYGLLPWGTLRDNVALGLRIRRFYGPDGRHAPRRSRISESDEERQVDEWLQRLDIHRVSDQLPSQVSGGQRQRAAIARALVLGPDLLLMDEPFSALDAPTRESLQKLTLDLCRAANLTVILVTHNIEEAAFVGQQVLILNDPPNRQARTLVNPHPTTADYRRSPAYQAACNRLREAVN